MSRYRVLVIGTAPSLKSSRATELLGFLAEQGITYTMGSDPAAVPSGTWDLVFFLSLDARPARPLQQWIDLVRAKKVQGRFLVLYELPLSDEWRSVLDPEIEIGGDHELGESIAYLFEGGDNTVVDEAVGTFVDEVGAELDAPVATSNESLSFSLDPMDNPGGASESFSESFLDSDSPEASEFSTSEEEPPQSEELSDLFSESAPVGEGELTFSMDSDAPALGGSVAPESAALDSLDDIADFSISNESSESVSSESESEVESPVALSSSDFDGLDFGSSEEVSSDGEALGDIEATQHPDSDISSPLAGRDTFNAEINVDELLAEEEVGLETHMSSTFDPHVHEELVAKSPMSSSSDTSTLQKYAALKEREAREKEATIQVLKGQVAKLDTKLSRSEAERRRLTLSSDEMKTQLSALEENLSQKQFHIQKVESTHHEEMRGLSLRLDNAIFQASKAQNKLEEFRERVRSDFMKIRAQERELFNKLELQKRDAEALLASKDEQLLNQKREIDRLQYETETLRERLMEETEKAEERASRLTRAVQSLRLANDMLSGLTEEVLPTASDNFGETKDDEEDAA